jgi:hypothetical protein
MPENLYSISEIREQITHLPEYFEQFTFFSTPDFVPPRSSSPGTVAS